MRKNFDDVLDRLSRVAGVRGAMLVDAQAGVIMCSRNTLDETTKAALAFGMMA